jgi:hypothetical protein
MGEGHGAEVRNRDVSSTFEYHILLQHDFRRSSAYAHRTPGACAAARVLARATHAPCCSNPTSFFPSFPCATSPPAAHIDDISIIKNLWTVTTPSPSAERNLIGSLVGKPARLTTGYTISLSNHALKLIYITLSYNISADPRPTPIAHRRRGRRPACSPAAHSACQRLTCYILTGWLARVAITVRFLREDTPLVQRSISWCAVARSCSVRI